MNFNPGRSSPPGQSLQPVRQWPSQTAAVVALIPYAGSGKIKGDCVPKILTLGKFREAVSRHDAQNCGGRVGFYPNRLASLVKDAPGLDTEKVGKE